MSGVETREVASGEDSMRLDRWFKVHFPALAHGRLQKLLRTGQVRVDGSRARANARLTAGQIIRVPPLGDMPVTERPARMVSEKDAAFVRKLVIYRDDDLLVLNKPWGLAVQGGTKTERHLDGMLDALVFDAGERPRLIHRLDRDTSGVIALARTRAAATELGRAFKTHEVRKVYWALVIGVPRPSKGTINLPLIKAGIAGDQWVRPVEEDDEEGGQSAVTHYATIAPAGTRVAWLALLPVTGRTHQLRAHLKAIDHPIVGDPRYGDRERHPGDEIVNRLHLHARSLTLPRPGGGEITVEAPLPEHMARTWAFFGFDPNEAGDPFAELEL